MNIYIIPLLILFIFVYAGFKRVNTYKSFTQGAKAAIKLCVDILPFIATILIAIQLFRVSGLLDILCDVLAPIFGFFGVPSELTAFIILKPFSGSGSISLFNEIVATHGADSYITRVASVIAGSSETVFYISAVYFSKTKIRRLAYAIPVALFCVILAAILAALVCRII
jgi:spore maturation protein B